MTVTVQGKFTFPAYLLMNPNELTIVLLKVARHIHYHSSKHGLDKARVSTMK